MAKYIEASEYREQALQYTARIVRMAQTGKLKDQPCLAHTFAIDRDEHLYAAGAYTLHWWGTLGDGSWSTSSFIAGGTGAVGMGMLVGSAIGNYNSRNRARRQAAANAALAWRPVDTGQVHVSDYGIYLTRGHHGIRRYRWTSITEADLHQPGVVFYNANTTDGPVQYLLRSDWAELIFAFWCLARNPNHPRFIADTWIDRATIERSRLRRLPAAPDN
jgi:hypothetical protein